MIKYLKKGHKLQLEIQSRQQVIENLRSGLDGVTSIDYSKEKLQGGEKSPDSRLVNLLNKIMLEEHEIDILNSELIDILDAINALEDIDERTLLRLRYLLGYKWETINEEMGMSARTVGRIHRRALKNIKKYLKM